MTVNGEAVSPQLSRLPVSAPYAQIEDTLLRDGGLIITGLLSKDHIAAMMKVLNRHYPPEHDFKYATPGSFFPQETKVLWSLAGRDAVTGHDVCMNPLLTRLREEILHMHITRPNDYGTQDMQKTTADIPPRLSLSVAFDMRPGARQQPLHRDEDVWGTTHEQPFSRQGIRQIGVLIAGTKSVRENGATLVIPGSHTWDDARLPRIEEAAYAEMEPGDALIFLSSLRHAGGANQIEDQTSPLARRVMFSYFFNRGYLRQEENMLVSIPRDVVLGMSEEMQKLIGYEASSSHCGFVDFKSPIDIGLKELFSRTAEEFLHPQAARQNGWENIRMQLGVGVRCTDQGFELSLSNVRMNSLDVIHDFEKPRYPPTIQPCFAVYEHNPSSTPILWPQLSTSEATLKRTFETFDEILPSIENLLATYRSRLVFTSVDGWVCSCRLDEEQPEEPVVYHFPFPPYWQAGSGDVFGMVTVNRDVVLAVEGELAIIKQNLVT